jgi:hypothetical protein
VGFGIVVKNLGALSSSTADFAYLSHLSLSLSLSLSLVLNALSLSQMGNAENWGLLLQWLLLRLTLGGKGLPTKSATRTDSATKNVGKDSEDVACSVL